MAKAIAKTPKISFTREMIMDKVMLVDKEINKIKGNHVSNKEWQELNRLLARRQQLQRLLDTM